MANLQVNRTGKEGGSGDITALCGGWGRSSKAEAIREIENRLHRYYVQDSYGWRRHAEIENAIRDLKYGVGLNHMPSGRFAANGAWLAVQVMAHNLARWTARIGLGQQIVTTKTLRRRVFALAGRITRSARRLTLHLPRRWPWEEQFSRALARLRAIPLPA